MSDEGEYWETRDIDRLSATFSMLQSAIDGLADGLRRYGLSAEAAEDPQIVASRVVRIAHFKSPDGTATYQPGEETTALSPDA